ncbi:MAG: tetratricopeptide repeat protein [Pseudarcicella sp.]|nr:tetratricopeptide repeat protein [Pseudarcicella sp.]MBP6410967.1 tetratricopeptide repeat protein [Pseudarcicella sp.]
MLKNLIVFAIIFSITPKAFSQSDYLEKRFNEGLDSYHQKKTQKAHEIFQSLGNSALGEGITEYAMFFDGISLLELKNLDNAKFIFEQLINDFPNWKQKDEVYFQLAKLNFEQENYTYAIDILAQIKDVKFKNDIYELKLQYISKINDKAKLENLTSENQQEIAFKKQLNIVKKNESNVTSNNRNIKIALMLPFELYRLRPNLNKKSNQFAIDLYQGMKLANKKLKTDGINVNLHVFDVGNDAEDVLEILNNPNFKDFSLTIGPLHSESNNAMIQYCQLFNIPMLHPFSKSELLIQNYSKSFLAHPSVVSQAYRAASFVKRKLSDLKTCSIFYTSSINDSLFASAYREQMMAQGFEILNFEKIIPNSDEIFQKLPVKSIGHIFLAASDQKCGISMLTALNKRGIYSPLLMNNDAINKDNFVKESYHNNTIYLIDSDYVNHAKPQMTSFIEEYTTEYGIVPSYFACQGYDMFLFWAKTLGTKGKNFQDYLNSTVFKNDYTLSGFNYQHAQDNQIVPITMYQNHKFVLVH